MAVKKKRPALPTEMPVEVYAHLTSRLVNMCPGHSRAVTIVFNEEKGVLVMGSCCETCTKALVDMARDAINMAEARAGTIH
jgi:hypothetical protein